jgi:FtsH-binding integral membrane protein
MSGHHTWASALIKMSLGAAQATFWGYAGLAGLSLAGIFLIYTGVSVARAFSLVAVTMSY